MYDKTSLDLINKQRQHLKDNFQDWNKILELEELYSTYNFMIFDLPKFHIDDEALFQNIWNSHNIDCGRVRTDIASPYNVDSTPRFRSLDILNIDPSIVRIWKTNYLDISDKFPKFYQQMFDLLPFNQISYVRLWQSIGPIRMHRDDSWWYMNIPTEVRIMIYDENDSGTLMVVPELKYSDLDFVNLPKETNSFSWNNVRCLHGSVKNNKKEKILACITGTFDLNKMKILLENSSKKFGSISKQTIDDPYSKLLVR